MNGPPATLAEVAGGRVAPLRLVFKDTEYELALSRPLSTDHNGSLSFWADLPSQIVP